MTMTISAEQSLLELNEEKILKRKTKSHGIKYDFLGFSLYTV